MVIGKIKSTWNNRGICRRKGRGVMITWHLKCHEVALMPRGSSIVVNSICQGTYSLSQQSGFKFQTYCSLAV